MGARPSEGAHPGTRIGTASKSRLANTLEDHCLAQANIQNRILDSGWDWVVSRPAALSISCQITGLADCPLVQSHRTPVSVPVSKRQNRTLGCRVNPRAIELRLANSHVKTTSREGIASPTCPAGQGGSVQTGCGRIYSEAATRRRCLSSLESVMNQQWICAMDDRSYWVWGDICCRYVAKRKAALLFPPLEIRHSPTSPK